MRSPDNALEVDQLTRVFDVSAPWLNRVIDRKPKRYLRAVQDVTFTVQKGKCLALVGEIRLRQVNSARLVTGLYDPSEGAIVFAPAEKGANRGKPLEAQMIFQDPHASLNPRWRVGNIIAEPIEVFGLRDGRQAIDARVAELLRTVGLSPDDANRFPHEFSGGQDSAYRLHERWPASPNFSSATNRPRHSMSPSRRRSSISCAGYRIAWPDLSLHQPQSRSRPPHGRSHRGDVSRPYRGGGRDRGALRQSATPIHTASAANDPRCRGAPIVIVR